jgi:carbonic anhydrase/acetyltransferase-like protein (isoleucine patch superfamily)
MPVYSLGGLTPRIGARVYLAETAVIIGDVEIGDDSSVWFGAVIRGDVAPIRIGVRTNVQDNAVVHVTGGRSVTTIGDDVTIGHLALVHGATVGHRCLLGMGSVLLDNAIVEDESFVAAGALVPPGARVPTRSMVVGRPAKKTRDLGEQDLTEIYDSASHYMQYARMFERGLSRV